MGEVSRKFVAVMIAVAVIVVVVYVWGALAQLGVVR